MGTTIRRRDVPQAKTSSIGSERKRIVEPDRILLRARKAREPGHPIAHTPVC
jgi:hypothetical protein